MASETSVALGVGVTLALFVLFAVALVFFGVYTNDSRTRSFEREREQRVELVRQRQRQEQEQWRERRLRDVVLLLIERGEALEGVSLAFQLPNRPEVSARRTLRSRRGVNSVRQNLEIELADEQENSRLDEEARRIARMPLHELLANGRPQNADAGPDVMQMLLDGQEIQRHTTSEDDSDFYLNDEDTTPASVTPFLSRQANEEARLGRGGGETAPPTPLQSAAPAPGQPQPQQGDGPASTNVAAGEREIDARTAAVLLQEQRLRESRELALLQELRREKRRKYRKTAEEVYGQGADYEHNPANDALLRIQVVNGGGTPGSPLWRFLTPLTSLRGNRSRRDKKSAFDGLSPQESTVYQRENTGLPKSPASGKKKNRSFEVAPF
ncbi:hypothetical protein conserved [Leishmania donovani]|uniref:Uncharacterized protein n=3 Tax=Leishmania donovani species complex TaxID=38574 RepID=A4I6V0_LEIIN|nr:conserved hypothetical protein [Leishmania infantum JPCM5]XP_003863266.1 hypothetical protein, conserved [Leishmania donovani]CAC9519682.1 hypothetical_protein_-_conserved [Leishmania infantum]CAJ1991368.1 hypothetical protein conserved [Leishmania donovani]CAM70527.1 conserved hypothetical protein [Leishmania infantum JPCM5]CBZ36577.1 hypothetical protein, conserved [Leishmania donovani]SUZ44395.1 hypothetical_protein_-_conserved [Leishmania infantum]|eukprot:XP_001467469.1 conserved hypothetical protein [Leishmania infantum JPCM5]